jgi:hypothetical protein
VDKRRLIGKEDIGYMTCMTLVLLGNYAQTGHFGGPLAYTPYNVAVHLAGPDLGGLRYDYRRPKHPYGDKFMLAGGHSVPTCYALWMIMGRRWRASSKPRATSAITSIRTSPCCPSTRWDSAAARARWPRCCRIRAGRSSAVRAGKLRGIRALAGHAEAPTSPTT